VVESTSDYWRPFVYLLEARALDTPFLAAAPHGSAMVRAA